MKMSEVANSIQDVAAPQGANSKDLHTEDLKTEVCEKKKNYKARETPWETLTLQLEEKLASLLIT